MTKLVDLTLAGYRMEKQAAEKKAGFASEIKTSIKKIGVMGTAKKVVKDPAVEKALLAAGTPAGVTIGYLAGKKNGKKEVEKQAGLLDIAKGVASVGKNLVKQNPTAAKAAIGGAVAGAAATKMTQTKQAEEKDTVSRKAARVGGAVAGGRLGTEIGEAVGSAGSAALRALRGAKRGPSVLGAGLGTVVGGVMGLKAGHGLVKDIQKKASTTGDKGLDKEEKDAKDPVGMSSEGKGKSSLIHAAKKEMAKAASVPVIEMNDHVIGQLRAVYKINKHSFSPEWQKHFEEMDRQEAGSKK